MEVKEKTEDDEEGNKQCAPIFDLEDQEDQTWDHGQKIPRKFLREMAFIGAFAPSGPAVAAAAATTVY